MNNIKSSSVLNEQKLGKRVPNKRNKSVCLRTGGDPITNIWLYLHPIPCETPKIPKAIPKANKFRANATYNAASNLECS